MLRPRGQAFVPMKLINQSVDAGCPWGGFVAPFGDAVWVMQVPLLKAISGEGSNYEPSAGNIPKLREGACGQSHSLGHSLSLRSQRLFAGGAIPLKEIKTSLS